jgi:cytochrome c oxidase subunit II
MKKASVLAGSLSLLLLTACAQQTGGDAMMENESSSAMDSTHSDSMMEDEGMMEDDSMMEDEGMMEDDSMMEDTTGMMGGEKVINVTAENWQFTPSTIRLKQGDKVTLRITAKTGTHGFMVADLGINVPIEEGGTVDVVIPTDAKGTFAFRCSIPCGTGHQDMYGQIIIE